MSICLLFPKHILCLRFEHIVYIKESKFAGKKRVCTLLIAVVISWFGWWELFDIEMKMRKKEQEKNMLKK